MSKEDDEVSEELYDDILSVSLREPDILRRLREETSPVPPFRNANLSDQGQFMALLVRLIAATRTIDLGVAPGTFCHAWRWPSRRRGRS